MGSPLGSILANAFLCHYEKLWFESWAPEFKPVVYIRYVDDIFVLFKSKDHLLLFAKYMNTRHKNLKFTFDFELNNSFSFLDVKITRGSNGFSTSVFGKVTFSGVFTNSGSFKCNNYPAGLIDQYVKNFLNKIYVPKKVLITLPKKDVLIFLPF